MKIKYFLCLPLLCLSLLINSYAFAIHDQLAIDIKATENDLQFCFTPDYNKNIYLAALLNNNLFFINEQNQLSPWDGLQEAPFFIKKQLSVKPICFPPLSKSLIQGIPMFVAFGSDFSDVLSNASYTCIFDGTFPQLPQQQRNWTVMVYIIGSTLESGSQHWASKDLMEILNGSLQMPNDNVNIVVTTGGSERDGWQTVKRSLISQGQQHVITDLGEKNMADPETLSDFVPWAATNFPADHYALVLWDHGFGSLGYGWDSSKAVRAANNGMPDKMTLPELHQAFKTIRSQLDAPLDIVSYDACFMANIEVAEITSAVADAMSASVEIEPSHGADYNYLFTQLAIEPPANGLEFGKLMKKSFLEQTQQQLSQTSDQTKWETDQIAYSVFDLTQLATFWNNFQEFATELDTILRTMDFLNPVSAYKMLSSGIIHAPFYPAMERNALRSRSYNQAITDQDVHIDLYAMLQTMLPDFPDLKSYADKGLSQLDQMVVEYDANPNVKKIYADAGRLSINIGVDLPYLDELPEAYQSFHSALDYYNQRKANDLSDLNDESRKSCYDTPPGMLCAAFPNWLRLPSSEVLEVEAYFGEYSEGINHIYLMKTIYQYQQEVTQSMELGVDGNQACKYQVCVNDTDCEDISITEKNDQRFADIILNQKPAVLVFCKGEENNWHACSVISQTDSVWGRSSVLYPGDFIAPKTLHWTEGQKALEEITGRQLTVEARPVILKRQCDPSKAMIMVSSYASNLQPAYQELCKDTSCICTAEDLLENGDDACKEVGTKAGVYIEP